LTEHSNGANHYAIIEQFIEGIDMTEPAKKADTIVITGAQEIIVGGVTINAAGGDVTVVGGRVEKAPANDTSANRGWSNPEVGQVMPDWTIYGGLTPDGKYQIFTTPGDLDFTKDFMGAPHYVTKSFNAAVRRIKKLNAETYLASHDDWQIPSLEVMKVLYKNMNKGSLKDSFNTDDDLRDFSRWPTVYWTSTPRDNGMPNMYDLNFASGAVSWHLKEGGSYTQNCRPVRLVPVVGA
jgi:hypothetical protein